MFCQGGKEGRKEGGKEGWRDGIKALFAFCSGTKYRMVQLVAHWYFEHDVDRRKEGSSSEHSVPVLDLSNVLLVPKKTGI